MGLFPPLVALKFLECSRSRSHDHTEIERLFKIGPATGRDGPRAHHSRPGHAECAQGSQKQILIRHIPRTFQPKTTSRA